MEPVSISSQSAARRLLLLMAILVIGFIASNLIDGGLSTIRLSSAPALSGIAAIALESPTGSALPVINHDYKMAAHYFDNNQWVVLSLSSPTNSFDPSIVVAQNQNGVYQIMLGPSSVFTSNQLTTVPGDVAAYLLQGGGSYETIPE